MHSTEPRFSFTFFPNMMINLLQKYCFWKQKSNQAHQSQAIFTFFFFFLVSKGGWRLDSYTDRPWLLFSMCITFKSCLAAATLAPPTSPRHTLLFSMWHRWHSYRQFMCERVRPMLVALSPCSLCSLFTLHFCQMCNIYSPLSRLWFCSEAYMTCVDMLLVILSPLVRREWQTDSCHARTGKT